MDASERGNYISDGLNFVAAGFILRNHHLKTCYFSLSVIVENLL